MGRKSVILGIDRRSRRISRKIVFVVQLGFIVEVRDALIVGDALVNLIGQILDASRLERGTGAWTETSGFGLGHKDENASAVLFARGFRFLGRRWLDRT